MDKKFGKYVNSFDYEIGRVYDIDELPRQTQQEIEIQFQAYSDLPEHNFDEYGWRFKLLQPEETEEYLLDHFDRYNIDDAINDPYLQKLIVDIKERGLDFPSVGVEGNHRALIYWYLKEPLPYLEPVPKNDTKEKYSIGWPWYIMEKS